MQFQLPNSIQIPLVVFDNLLPQISSLSELKIVFLAFRHGLSWDATELTEDLFENLTGLQNGAVKAGLNAAVKHRILNEKRTNLGMVYTINFATDIDELEQPVIERKQRTDLHGRLLGAIHQIIGATCDFRKEGTFARRIVTKINSNKYQEEDVFECLKWANEHKFNFWSPSLLSVDKLMPTFVRLKRRGELDTFDETKLDRGVKVLKERDYDEIARKALGETA